MCVFCLKVYQQSFNVDRPATPPASAHSLVSMPMCTREVYAAAVGLPIGVVNAHADRGYIPCVRVGKYSLVNLEALRVLCARRAEEFAL